MPKTLIVVKHIKKRTQLIQIEVVRIVIEKE